MKTNTTYEGYAIDNLTRIIASNLLQRLGCSDIYLTAGNNATDILCKYNTERVIVEVKGRGYSNYPSNIKAIKQAEQGRNYVYSSTYDDTTIEQKKYNAILKRIQNKEASIAILITVYDDDTISVCNIQGPHYNTLKWCKKTTYTREQYYVPKQLVHYNNTVRTLFEFRHNDTYTDFQFKLIKENND